MATAFIVFVVTSLMVTVALGQQRPVPPTFTRSTLQSRDANQLNLDPQQPMPQPFRRVSLPLYRGRGFSLEGQEPIKPVLTQQTFQPRPVENFDGETAGNDAPQPTRQAPQQQFERTQQQQVDRVQQQQQNIDRIQVQPEKQFSGIRPQPPQIQPIETQPNFVRKVVQRPLKRVRVTEDIDTISKSPETIQRLKLERTESADKQRAKKPVSQVLRRYRDDNPDGSITWGFENDDGTFKEETIGVDCVTRGKYGYVDPEGVKREYSYQSGVPCDKDRRPLSAPQQEQGAGSSAVQEAQASDTYGYIDYTKNQYVMANGQTINLNGMAKNRARKPVVRKTVTPVQHSADQRF